MSVMKALFAIYKQNATHVNTFVTVAGILIALVSGAPVLMIVVISIVLVVGAYAISSFLKSTPIPSSSSLRTPEDLSRLAEQILSHKLQDDDDRTRLHCEGILYSLERIRFHDLEREAQSQLFYALAVTYTKLIVHFSTVANDQAVDDVLRRILIVKKNVTRTKFPNESLILSFLSFAEAYIAYRRNDLLKCRALLVSCVGAETPKALRSRALDIMGTIEFREHDFQNAESHYRISLELKHDLNDTLGRAITYGNLGRLYFSCFEFEKCIECFEQNISLSAKIGNARGIYQSKNHIGMALLSIQRPIEAIKAFCSSIKKCESSTAAEAVRYQNDGFANLGLWLSYTYLGEQELGKDAHLAAKEGFIKGNLPFGTHLLEVYERGLEAVEANNSTLLDSFAGTVLHTIDHPADAGAFRLLQTYALSIEFQEMIISSARMYFDQQDIAYYRAKFNLIELKRSIISKATKLPSPFDSIILFQLQQGNDEDNRTFFLACEEFLRWMNFVLIAASSLQLDLATVSRRLSMGSILRNLLNLSLSLNDAGDSIECEISGWTAERNGELEQLVQMRNKWAHGTSSNHARHELDTIKKYWIQEITDFLFRFEAQVNAGFIAPQGFVGYRLVRKRDGQMVDVSPFMFLDSETNSSATMLIEADKHMALYETMKDGKIVKFPVRDVFGITQLAGNFNGERNTPADPKKPRR